MRSVLSLCFAAALALPVAAQDRTLADIRQDLNVLFVEMQRLKRELSTTGGASVAVQGSGTLERLDSLEAELTRLIARTEELEARIDRIVADGTNRIGDLEFRLVELEGGDTSALGETTTLGGDVDGGLVPAPDTSQDGDTELAVGEQSDFERAKAALDAGNYQDAVIQFLTFTETYTGGPLTGDAHYYRGLALMALGDTPNAARAFLESFSGSPTGARAPDALLQLGIALGELGQLNEACISLAEVGTRYPGSPAASQAATHRQGLNCP